MTHMLFCLLLLWTSPSPLVAAPPPVDPAVATVIDRYVRAIGGSAALAATTTQVIRGTFDNGRGLNQPYVMYVRRPNQRVTIIGRHDINDAEGSGRGYDGRVGWDKSFIGTGLRTVTGPELEDLARNADLFRPLRLAETCPAASLDPTPAAAAPVDVVRCDLPDRVERWWFDRTSGLLLRLETTTGDRSVRTYFEDYRETGGILTPFRERIVTPGPTIVYTASSIRYNETIDESVFRRPLR